MNRDINQGDFQKLIVESHGLSLVKFYAEWSGPCQVLLPLYNEMAKTYQPSIHFFSVNIEKEQAIKDHFGIRELPTLIFFHNGEVVDHVAGMISRNLLIAKLENHLAKAQN